MGGVGTIQWLKRCAGCIKTCELLMPQPGPVSIFAHFLIVGEQEARIMLGVLLQAYATADHNGVTLTCS